jgi:hypothetical protein
VPSPSPDTAVVRRAVRLQMERLGLGSVLRWCPHIPHPKQLELILATEDEVLFGGAAGGGKSDAMLMRLLRYVHIPGYSAIAFRRTHTDLALAGSLMSRAHEWGLREKGAHWNGQDKVWTFPSGAKLTFAYLDNDQDRWRYKSAEFQQIAWDELTQFPNDLGYRFLFSRVRRPENKSNPLAHVPLQSVAATNPGDAGHAWVMARWGLRDDGTQASEWDWRDPQVIDAKPERVTASDRRFIRSVLEDNPSVDAVSYDRGLQKLDATTYSQQRKGLWLIDGSHLVFRYRSERNTVGELPTWVAASSGVHVPLREDDWHWLFGVDLGGSDSSPTTAFLSACWNNYEPTLYVAKGWQTAALDDDEIAEIVREDQELHGDRWRGAVIDVGGLGQTYLKEARKRVALAAEKAEKSDKPGFRKLLNGDLEKGLVKIVDGAAPELQAQLSTLIWNDQRTDVRAGLADHSADALLYTWRKSTAFRSRAPDQQPPPGSAEALDLEAKRIREREKRRYQERRNRAPGEGW